MSNQSSMRHAFASFACFATLSAIPFAIAFEPGESEAATGRGAGTNHSVAVSKTDAESYVAEIKATSSYVVGKEGFVDVVIVSKDPFHLNEAYPFKFKAFDPAAEGVTYPKPLLARADGKFDAKTGTFRLPFTASKAGKFSIGGTLSLSVCSPSTCLMEKVELAVDVDVK